ncbi:MAG: hypothetical protein LC746_16610 [Acidobacteria bacterium]|nr:hypothetical protein [Acidobacteriota bacterium]
MAMIRERVRIVGLVILSLVAAGASSPAPPQTTATGAADAHRESADVWFSVEDRNGQCAPTLGAEDLRVSEDGAAQQIRSFAFRRDAARAIVVAVDNSASQSEILPSVKRVAQALVAALARPGRDTVAVLSFADEATLEQNFTADAARAEKAVADIYVANPEAAYIGGILLPRQRPGGARGLHRDQAVARLPELPQLRAREPRRDEKRPQAEDRDRQPGAARASSARELPGGLRLRSPARAAAAPQVRRDR